MISRVLPWVALACATIAVAADKSPYEIIETTASELSTRLDGRKAYFEANRDELYGLIDELLLPRFDTRYAGYLVMGKQNWRAASEEQRQRFIDAFYRFLLRSYSDAVLDFDQGQVKVVEPEVQPEGRRAVVKTEMHLNDGTSVPVNYSMRHSEDGWRAYDVRIEGVSYVQNYRNQFAAEIDAKGIDAVIARLENETASPGTGK